MMVENFNEIWKFRNFFPFSRNFEILRIFKESFDFFQFSLFSLFYFFFLLELVMLAYFKCFQFYGLVTHNCMFLPANVILSFLINDEILLMFYFF